MTSTITAHAKSCDRSLKYLSKHQNLVIRIDAILAIELKGVTIMFFINGSEIQLRFINLDRASIEFKKAIKEWGRCYKGVR